MTRTHSHSARLSRRSMSALLALCAALALSLVVSAGSPGPNIAVTAAAVDQFNQTSSIAQNPATTADLAVAYVQDGNPAVGPTTPALQTCYVAASTNGGAGWTTYPVVNVSSITPPNTSGLIVNYKGCQSPGLSYSPDGTTLYYVFQLAVSYIGDGKGGRFDYGFLYFTTSPNDGVSWSAPIEVDKTTGFGTFAGKNGGDWYPAITVDQASTAIPPKGNIYVTWTHYPTFGSDSIYAAESTNGGAAFANPVLVSPSGESKAGQFGGAGGGGSAPGAIVAEGGRVGILCVAWPDYTPATGTAVPVPNPDADVACQTSAGAMTFAPPVVFKGQLTSQSCAGYGTTTFVCGTVPFAIHIAAGPCPSGMSCTDGQLVVAWDDSTQMADTGKGIFVFGSLDGGVTYALQAGHPASAGPNHWQIYPWLSIVASGTNAGRLDLGYYDVLTTQVCLPGPGSARNVEETSSTDLGATFTPPTQVTTVCSDESVKPPSPAFGSPIAGRVVNASYDTTGFFGWTDARNAGSEATGPQDVYGDVVGSP